MNNSPAKFIKNDQFKTDNYLLIYVDTKKLDHEWSKDDGFYIPPNGESAISDRRERFRQWMEKNPTTPIEAPFVCWNDYKHCVGFTDGRHRFSVLRDMGYPTVAVVIPKNHLKYFRPMMASGKVAALGTDFRDALDGVEGSFDAVKVVLAKYKARQVLVYPEGVVYTLGVAPNFTVVDVENDGYFQVYDSVNEFISRADVEQYIPDAASKFNTNFWEFPQSLYHATPSANLSSIMSRGLTAKNETRGRSNRSIHAAVFTTTEPDEMEDGAYGDTLICINTHAMKNELAPEQLPYVEQEPDVAEGSLRETLARRIGLEDYQTDCESGMSPYTVILNGSVAPKYLSVWGEEKMAAKTAATPRNTAAATTSTPEFKAWFKNSKVVDDNGNPLPMYHGRHGDFSVFNTPSHFGSPDAAEGRLGVNRDIPEFSEEWFEEYGEPSTEMLRELPPSEGENIVPVYLSIQNPLRIVDNGQDFDLAVPSVAKDLLERKIITPSEAARLGIGKVKVLITLLKRKGYDGLVYSNTYEGFGEDSYVAFDPNQIKSAIGNSGKFDVNNHDITASVGPLYHGTTSDIDKFEEAPFQAPYKYGAKKVSGEDVVSYVQKMNKWSDRQTAYQVVGLDAGGDYVLKKVSLRELEAGDNHDPERGEEYANMKTPFPPIVLDMDGQIRDGNHRVYAAKLRGDKTIMAYVPLDSYKTASASNVPSCIAELNEKFPVNPDNPAERVLMAAGKPVVFFEVAERKGRLRLKGIRSTEPNSGLGTLALQRILKIVDRHGVTVELTASPYGNEPGRIGGDELKSWYGKFGFSDEAGFDTSLGYMIRESKTDKTAKAEYMTMADIQRIAQELMPVLKPGLPVPEFKIVNSPRSRWLGQCIWTYGLRGGQLFGNENTTIEIQKAVMVNEESLRRIIAHELCHHETYLAISRPELYEKGYQRFEFFNKRQDGHGKDFIEVASRFNAKYGEKFVSRTSDEKVITDVEVKPYYILIMKENGVSGRQRIGYEQSAHMTAKQRAYILEKDVENYRLTRTDDPRFIKGAVIGPYNGWSYFRESDIDRDNKLAKLAELFNQPDIRITEKWEKPKPTEWNPDATEKCSRCGKDTDVLEMFPGKRCFNCYRGKTPTQPEQPKTSNKTAFMPQESYIWAMTPSLKITDGDTRHANWFKEMKLPYSGAAFDRIPRGQFRIDRKHQEVRIIREDRQDFVPDDLLRAIRDKYEANGYTVEEPTPEGRFMQRVLASVTDPYDAEWSLIKQGFMSGIVYHGTTKTVADLIVKDGFRGLEFDAIVADVLALYGKRLEQLPQKRRTALAQLKRSYTSEHHLVSTSPSGECASRWAGDGGEIPKQIEAYILGKYVTRDVKNSRLKGEAAVLKCRIKNFESTEHYGRAKQMCEGMEKLVVDGGTSCDYTKQEACEYLWSNYVNFLCEPKDLEVLEVITGADLEELKKHPLEVI